MMKLNTFKIFPVLLMSATSNVAATSNANTPDTVTIATLSSAPTPFNGFYAGAFAGGVRIRNNLEFNLNIGGVGALRSIKAASNTSTEFLYGLMAGYGRNLSGYYLGAEIGIQADTTNKIKNYNYTFTGPGGSVTVPLKAKYHRGPVLSIAPRLGVVFGSSYLAYIKPALEISKDWATFIDDDGDTLSSKKKFKFTFVPGIGLEQAFSNNMLVRVEYSYNLGSKITEKGEEGGNSGSVSLKYTSHAIKVGMAYQF